MTQTDLRSVYQAMGITAWTLRPEAVSHEWYLLNGTLENARLAIVLVEAMDALTPSLIASAQKLQEALSADALLCESSGGLSFPLISAKLDNLTSLRFIILGESTAWRRYCLITQISVKSLTFSHSQENIQHKRQIWQDVKQYKLSETVR
jgi:DNA polymerase III psi subunit